MTEPSAITPVVSVIIGSTSAIVSTTACAPLTRVKILMQTHGEIVKSGRLSEPYKGAYRCMTRVYRTEGVASFWRGNLVNCIKAIPGPMITFAIKQKLDQILNVKSTTPGSNHYVKAIGSGALAGLFSAFILYPLDYCHNRLVCDVKSVETKGCRQFKGITDVFRKTLALDGVVGLYRGFAISCVGIAVYRGCYFGFYDTLRPIFLGENTNLGLKFMLGYVTTICAGLVAYPFDTIRRRMLLRSGEPIKYKGAFDCARQVVTSEGPRSLMRGAVLSILVGFMGVLTLIGYDSFKATYIRRSKSE